MSTPHRFNETIPSDLEAAERIQDRIIALVEKNGFSDRDVFGMRLALEEAIVNAIKHGNRMDPDKTVRIQCEVDPTRVCVEIEDQGPGFNPVDVPDPTAEENLEKPGGRGIMLMKAFMTRVEYVGRGNQVVLEKVRDPSES
ncbi:MAG: ATP-binding protein [Planctomycetaceae bacterium]|nr:ATP-binding protein [Planctomycetaceae bacterium]